VFTPRGPAIFPALNEPDYKFKLDTGEFHARLRLRPDAPGLAELIEQAEAIRDEAYDARVKELTAQKKGALLKKLKKADVVREELDQETGDPTGFVILRASKPYAVTPKKGPNAGKTYKFVPDIFDAKGKQLKNPPKIGSGSELILNVTIMDYEMAGEEPTIGAKFELNAAQVIKLVEGGARTASDYGFGTVDDGDEIEDGDAPQGGFKDQSGDGDGGGDDF